MIFSSVYAASRYANIQYGLRNTAAYTSSLGEAITAGDSALAVAQYNIALLNALSAQDVILSQALYITQLSESCITADIPLAMVSAVDLITEYLLSQHNNSAVVLFSAVAAEGILSGFQALTALIKVTSSLRSAIISDNRYNALLNETKTRNALSLENRQTLLPDESSTRSATALENRNFPINNSYRKNTP